MQRKTRGISGFDALFYILTDTPDQETAFDAIDDETFSNLIICEVHTSVEECVRELSKTHYLKTNPEITTILDENGYSIIIKKWLDMNVLEFEGNPLFDLFTEKGEGFELSGSGVTIPAIGIAASVIVKDICRRGILEPIAPT